MTDASSRVGRTGGAVRAFLWAVASFGGRKLLTFVGTLVLARILVPEDFGLVAAGVALLTYLEMALDLGVGSTVIYEQEEGVSERVHTAFTLNLGLGLILALGGVALAPLVAEFFQAPESTNLFRIMFLYLVVKAAGQVPDAVLRRDLAFRRRMVAEIARGAVKIAIAIPLALAGAGAWSIVLGMIGGELVGTAITWAAARFRPRLRLDRAAITVLLRYGTTMLGVRLVSELANNGDYLVVGNRLGPEQLGIYSVAYRVPELLLVTVFWLYSLVAFPVYSRAGMEDLGRLKRAMLRATKLTTLFAFPAGVGLAIVADDAVNLLFSDRWEAAIAPMTVIALGLAVSSVSVASSDVLPSIGRPGQLLLVNGSVLVPTIVAMVVVAPFGLVAVATVQLASTVVFVPWLQFLVNRAVGADGREVFSALLPALAAAGGVLATAWPVHSLMNPGAGRLVAAIVAGVMGAGLGILVAGRSTLDDVGRMISEARGD
jgi:lipopolysaccharide exporter